MERLYLPSWTSYYNKYLIVLLIPEEFLIFMNLSPILKESNQLKLLVTNYGLDHKTL